MIRLFTSSFEEANPARQAEYDECLRRNVACPEIDEVCIIAEGRTPPLDSSKIQVRLASRRPTYSDYLSWIAEVSGPHDVSVIANADIFFDSQLRIFKEWELPRRTAFALARWELGNDGKARLTDRNDSQDAWIFRGAVGGVMADFPVGVPRCDNRFASELERAGYELANPAFSLRSYHVHDGDRPSYPVEPAEGFVPPPYRYIWPHNLWPLHRTLWHNATHSGTRVGWRLDKRHWSRTLKLHWLARGMSVLTRPFRGSA